MTTGIIIAIMLMAVILFMTGFYFGAKAVIKDLENKTWSAYLNKEGLEIDNKGTHYIYKIVKITKGDYKYEY